MIGCQFALGAAITDFNLKGNMADLKVVFQFMGDLFYEGIARVTGWYQQVGG